MPGLDLVDEEQRTVLVGDGAELGEKSGRRRHDSAFALHRLDEDGRYVRAHRGAHRSCIAVGHVRDAGERRARTLRALGRCR